MLSTLAGEAVTITVPFTRDGEPFVPDANSVSWSLRDHTGIVIATSPVVSVSDTQMQVDLLSTQAAIASDRTFEKRTLVVRAEQNGQPYLWSTTYRIHKWLNLSTSAEDVRAFIGCGPDELPDQAVDLVEAYLTVDALTPLNTALTAGTVLEVHANRAVMAQAVLDVLPSLAQRLAKKESDGNRSIERFTLDLVSLEAKARHMLRAALDAVGAADDTATTPTIFIVTTRTDPVTGS